jgi:hypothetical protein
MAVSNYIAIAGAGAIGESQEGTCVREGSEAAWLGMLGHLRG